MEPFDSKPPAYPQTVQPPSGAYMPQGMQSPGGTATVIMTGPPLVLGPEPTTVVCPHCKQRVVTLVQYENGTLTWLCVGGLCLIGCWLGCCLIPTCINDVKDGLHTCPNCNNFLGRYKRLS